MVFCNSIVISLHGQWSVWLFNGIRPFNCIISWPHSIPTTNRKTKKEIVQHSTFVRSSNILYRTQSDFFTFNVHFEFKDWQKWSSNFHFHFNFFTIHSIVWKPDWNRIIIWARWVLLNCYHIVSTPNAITNCKHSMQTLLEVYCSHDIIWWMAITPLSTLKRFHL